MKDKFIENNITFIIDYVFKHYYYKESLESLNKKNYILSHDIIIDNVYTIIIDDNIDITFVVDKQLRFICSCDGLLFSKRYYLSEILTRMYKRYETIKDILK